MTMKKPMLFLSVTKSQVLLILLGLLLTFIMEENAKS